MDQQEIARTDDTKAATAPTPDRRWNISDTLVVASIPAVGYLLAYALERGYCDRFFIPPEFITLNYLSIFSVAVSLSTFAYALLLVVYYYSYFGRKRPFVRRLVGLFLILVSMVVLAFVFDSSHSSWFWPLTLGIWALAVMANLVSALILAWWFKKPFASTFVGLGEGTLPEHLLDFLIVGLGRPIGMLTFCVLCLFAACRLAGSGMAGIQEVFPTLTDKPDVVVLRIYGENAVCARFDRQARALIPEFTVVKLGSDRNLFLRMERIGPLTPRPFVVLMPTTLPAAGTTQPTTNKSAPPSSRAATQPATTHPTSGTPMIRPQI